MTDLAVPIRVKIELEARLEQARGEARMWESRAKTAEEREARFKRDARGVLLSMAERLTTDKQRKEAVITLQALARRLELEVELR